MGKFLTQRTATGSITVVDLISSGFNFLFDRFQRYKLLDT